MQWHRPLIAVLFAGMYSRATTENDGRALACKTAYALELAFFSKREDLARRFATSAVRKSLSSRKAAMCAVKYPADPLGGAFHF
jgi:hypothetical protein